MNFVPANTVLQKLLQPEFKRMSEETRELLDLEKNGDQEVFLLCHNFANTAAPIRGNIALGSSFNKIMEVCDYAIHKIENQERLVEEIPIQTVHSQLFSDLQAEYLDIFRTARTKIIENKHLLENQIG